MLVNRIDQVQIARASKLTAEVVFLWITGETMLLGRKVNCIGVIWATVIQGVNVGTMQALFPVETRLSMGSEILQCKI